MKNAPLHPVLRFVYGFFRLLTAASLPVYFRERLVLGREHFRFDGPAFVAVNHPSTLMDVLNTGLQVRQEMYFLANYGLFRTPFTNWFFRTLFCIPVKRLEDMRPGEKRNNDHAFDQSYLHLEKNGVLFIAPEGASWMHRYVGSPLKSGIARIAFGAEVRNNWQLDLKIIPVGLTYDHPNLFRSRTAVCAGEPLRIADWRERYEQNPNRAISHLLDTLHQRLTQLSLHARDAAGEQFLHRIERLIHHPGRRPWKSAFQLERARLNDWLDDDALRADVSAYFQKLRGYGIRDAGVARAAAATPIWLSVVLLLLGAPLALAAAFIWFLPCFFPWAINRASGLYVGYSSTVKLLMGMVFFPLAMWGLYRLTSIWLPQPWPWAALAIAPLLGLFLERYLGGLSAVACALHAGRVGRKALELLIAERAGLVARVVA